MLYAVIGKVTTQTQGEKKVCVYKSEDEETSETNKTTYNAALTNEDLRAAVALNNPGFAAAIDGTVVANNQLTYVLGSFYVTPLPALFPFLQQHLDTP